MTDWQAPAPVRPANPNNPDNPDKNRILWRCRRGTRELDVVLRGFVDSRYDRLDARARRCLMELLDESDPDIMAWIAGLREPCPRYRDLVRLLRQFAGRLVEH